MASMQDMTDRIGRERESMVQGENGRWAKISTYEKMLVGEVEGRTIWVRMVDREGVMVEGRCQVGYRLEVRVGLWSGEMIGWGK